MKMYKKRVWGISILILTSKAALMCLALLLRCIPTTEKLNSYVIKQLITGIDLSPKWRPKI